ncbi:LysR substrate-binding domain-containing protein [Vibrio sp. SS-MA-C1-2]|uniref:LysR substrate-binding domain-containing protein n=1 Tax=Vibrio sp. SS-MA-C1-2 TaxID=2908646 RepID=UPI001F3E9200|nr:LysR substrate-binding domain-containing protein [Vibrio sp. SS-MA-C1-2]UJF17768.1 LysR substrate-binding domain-containing protein [Vibrio sp. SS-MA-C1-2]
MYLWEGMTEFVYVAERDSFTEAARALSISTAQVSRQISALEKRLNIKLFYRTTRKVSLTEEGQIYYQHARELLDGLESAEMAMTNLQQSPQGKIKLTVPVSYGERYILPLINNFMRLYPDIEIMVQLTNKKVDLHENNLDLAIRLGHLESSSMMAKQIGKRTLSICASPQYLDKYDEPTHPSQLKDHQCLLGTYPFWRCRIAKKEQKLKVSGRLSCSSGIALLDAAKKGLGIVQLPNYYLEQAVLDGELKRILQDFKSQDEGIWALYPQNRHLSFKVKLLMDYLSDHLSHH